MSSKGGGDALLGIVPGQAWTTVTGLALPQTMWSHRTRQIQIPRVAAEKFPTKVSMYSSPH